MTPTECVDVVEFLAARCPAMRMHENTPDSWYVDLAAYSRDDALEAVRRRSRRQSFVSLAEILDELDTIVRHRAGRERSAALEHQRTTENPPVDLTDRSRPLRALMAGSPIQSAPRATWQQRRALPPRPTKPPLTDAELAAARALLEAATEDAE